MKKRNLIIILLIASALLAICMLTADTWLSLYNGPTPTKVLFTISDTPSTSTNTPSSTATSSIGIPSQTPTPYIVTYNGFIHCRRLPDTQIEVFTIIRGESFVIIQQNQTENWLLVKVHGYNEPCWIYRYVDNLNLNPTEIAKVPTYIITVVQPTFTFPPP